MDFQTNRNICRGIGKLFGHCTSLWVIFLIYTIFRKFQDLLDQNCHEIRNISAIFETLWNRMSAYFLLLMLWKSIAWNCSHWGSSVFASRIQALHCNRCRRNTYAVMSVCSQSQCIVPTTMYSLVAKQDASTGL